MFSHVQNPTTRNNSNFSSHQTMGGRLYCCSGGMHSTGVFAHFPRISVKPAASLFKLFPWTVASEYIYIYTHDPVFLHGGGRLEYS